MNKTIQKIENYKEKWLTKALAKARQGYDEANECFSDTGYDRYFKKMERYEKEIDELEAYQHQGEQKQDEVNKLSTEQYKEYKEMKQDMKCLASHFFYMFADFQLPETVDINSIQRILEKYKYAS